MRSPGAAVAGNYGKYDVNARFVWHYSFFVASGDPHTFRFETTDLQGGADTQVHIWDVYNNELVDSNDDWATGNCQPAGSNPSPYQSCVEFTTTEGYYTVVVLSYQYGVNTGTADLIRRTDGQQTNYFDDIPVGGTWTSVDISGPDTLQTALLNQGTTDTVMYGAGSTGGGLVAIDDDGGVGYASRISATPVAWVATGTYSPGQGMARLYANDLYFDQDGDGLGPELEAALCTCDTATHYTCGSVCNVDNPKDSDYDGIPDDYETFGKDGSPPQHLLRWGADPARMDLFVETTPLVPR